jgi:hypothetical protein
MRVHTRAHARIDAYIAALRLADRVVAIVDDSMLERSYLLKELALPAKLGFVLSTSPRNAAFSLPRVRGSPRDNRHSRAGS